MDTINLKQKFIEMFTDDNIRTLREDAGWCAECGGLGWHDKIRGYISLCTTCFGKGYIPFNICACGNVIDNQNYSKCSNCHTHEFKLKQFENNKRRYEKAAKVSCSDYEGKFWDDSWDYVKDKDDFEDWLYDQIISGDSYPTWVFGTYQKLSLNIDIYNTVHNACEDSYEGIEDNLDMNSLLPIQEQIDQWIMEQGDSAYTYEIDYKVVVELDDLIEEIKQNIYEKGDI
jgi:hypothetical protein